MQQDAYDESVVPCWAKMGVYWLRNQVSVALRSDLPLSKGKSAIIESLHLRDFNQFLGTRGFQLQSFDQSDISHSVSESVSESDMLSQHSKGDVSGYDDDEQINNPIGKYVFSHPSGHGSLVLSFFHIEQVDGYMKERSSSSYDGMSAVPAMVNLINDNLDMLRQEGKIPILVATPNWLIGSVGMCVGQGGCLVLPPIPVTENSPEWHTMLPDLSDEMQRRTGAGVRVFVLDTRPQLEQIKKATQRAGKNNSLLKRIVAQIESQGKPSIVFNDPKQSLPDILEDKSKMQPETGRDIYGHSYGFPMADHGLCVTGIIRDLAPEATIEYTRVLNNYGASSVAVLMQALEDIQHRMLPTNPDTGKTGDLHKQPIVINMSLVSASPREGLDSSWLGSSPYGPEMINHIDSLVDPLQLVIQGLTSLGAVIVAASGNDADRRQRTPSGMRFIAKRSGPRSPAAFPEVISVGAVDRDGQAAVYSNYPVAPFSAQHNGVATFGGGIPTPVVPFDPDGMTGVDLKTIDAIVGLYTSSTYPALSAEDDPNSYPASSDNVWAYWIGTSFAAPIISAVAARVLEELVVKSPLLQSHQWHGEVMRAFTHEQGQQEWLTKDGPLHLQTEFSEGTGGSIGLLHAQQEAVTAREGLANSSVESNDTSKEKEGVEASVAL